MKVNKFSTDYMQRTLSKEVEGACTKVVFHIHNTAAQHCPAVYISPSLSSICVDY